MGTMPFMFDVSEGTRNLVESVWNDHYNKFNDDNPIQSLEKVVNSIYQNDEKGIISALDAVTNGYFCPGGRVHAGAGTNDRVTLINCVSGETLVHTGNGVHRAKDLDGLVINVLTIEGKYRTVEWKNFGYQKLWQVELDNGDVMFTTEDHEWVVSPINKNRNLKVKTTKNLQGSHIPFQHTSGFKVDEFDFNEGVRHGIVFGDGSNGWKQCYVRLFYEKRDLEKFFSTYPSINKPEYLQITHLPMGLKELPPVDSTPSYLRGFIAGLIATDGHVDHNGHTMLHHADESRISTIRDICTHASLPTQPPKISREKSPYDGSYKPVWKLSLVKYEISMNPYMILRESHLNNLKNSPISSQRETVKVISVKETDRYEKVYCCTEPETHTMVIGNGYLTKQCFVSGTIHDSLDSIMDRLKEAALTQQQGGGIGMNFGTLRPKGAVVVQTNSVSSGVLPFMDMWHAMCSTIRSAGTRRGAMMGIVPCIAGKTRIDTLEGKIPVADLEGKTPYVYCTDKHGNVYVRQAEAVWCSGTKETIRVHMDTHDYIECTPDHKFLLSDFTWREAGKLKIGDSLAALNRTLYKSGYTYLGVSGTRKKVSEHVAVYEMKYDEYPTLTGKKREPHMTLAHHRDGDKLNNTPDNIERMTLREHAMHHSDNLVEMQKKITEKRRGKTWEEFYGDRSEEVREKYKKSRTGQSTWNSGVKGDEYKGHFPEGFSNQHGVNHNHRVTKIEYVGEQPVYDIAVPDYHNFSAEGVFIHNCWHPDVLEFIDAKHTKGRLTHFNVSVAITHEFMEAVDRDEMWVLHFPIPHSEKKKIPIWDKRDKQVSYIYETLPARKLWDKLMRSTYEYAEPGVVFIDRINDMNNLFYCEKIYATNPCVTPDTIVNTGEWAARVIDIIPGDKILTAGLLSGRAQDIEVNEDMEVFKVRFSDGGELRCTAHHIFQVREHAHAGFENKCLNDIDRNELVTVTGGPRYFKKEEKSNCDYMNLYGLDEFDYGFQYGASRVKSNWVKGDKEGLNKEVVEAILGAVDEDKNQSKLWFDDHHFLRVSQRCRWGIVAGVLACSAVIENEGKDSFQIVVPRLHDRLLQQLRMMFLHCDVHPDWRESDNSLILKDENLRSLMNIGPLFEFNLIKAVQRHASNFPLKPIKWYARIHDVQRETEKQDVFDIHEPITDTWITNGFVSKGCVPYDTPILTRDGYKDIGDTIGEEIEVWNGFEWSKTTPFSTGKAQLYKVTFDNGVELVCDDRHRFPVNGSPVHTLDLRIGDKLDASNMPVVEKGKEYSIDGYSQGFYAGDGSEGRTKSSLYKVKYCCMPRLRGTFGPEPPSKQGIWRGWNHGPMLEKDFVPIHGSIDYCLDWLAGLIDSDGTVSRTRKSKSVQISSIDKKFLQNVRLMLTRLGVQSHIGLMKKAEMKAMPGGVYQTQDSYRLSISNPNIHHLVGLGLKTERVDISLLPDSILTIRPYQNKVKAIEKTDRFEETFCLKESLRESCNFNGINTLQCGEQPLPPYGQCDLGSINLARMVIDPFTAEPSINWAALKKAIEVGVRFLDNVLDETNYPLEEQLQEAMSKRRIGLGITGLGNFLEFLCVRYGSVESLRIVGATMKFIFNQAYYESALLARERGAFPLFELSEFKKSSSWKKLDRNIQEFIEKTGLRNGVLLTVAPTGSTSIYYGNVSGGIEPVFSHRYERRVLQPDSSVKSFYVHDYGFDKYVSIFGEPHKLSILPDYMVTASDISVDEHLEMQAAVQYWVDSSISKTINCPADMTFDDFKNVYKKAYDLGLKGCTTYRPSDVRGYVLKEVEDKDDVYKPYEGTCCSNPNIIDSEGCETCLNCGVSKCSL